MRTLKVSASPIHGLGVFAARAIAQGEEILTVDDRRVVDARSPLRPELSEYDYYLDYLAKGKKVLLQNPERHLNHGCESNTCLRTRAGERRLVALRDIAAGEEFTLDYSLNRKLDKSLACRCGSQRCRGTIFLDYFKLPAELQKDRLPLLEAWFIEEHGLGGGTAAG